MDLKEESTMVNKLYPLKLYTLSPIAINSGDTLGYISNYFYDEDKLYYLSEDDWINIVQDEYMKDEYIESIRNMKFSESLIEEIGKIKMNLRNASLSSDLIYHKGKELHSILKSNQNPYIPGTTIKGAVMNAIFYSWLKDKEEEQINLLHKIDPLTHKSDYKEFKLFMYEFNVFMKDLYAKFLGSRNGLYNASSFIGISDSNAMDFSSVTAVGIKQKIYKNTGESKESLDIIQEYIIPGIDFDITLSLCNSKMLWKNQNDSYMKNIYKDDSLKTFFSYINTFTRDYLEYESGIYKSDNYTNMINELSSIKLGSNEALLCIGSGKSYFLNTISLLLKNENEVLFQKMVKRMVNGGDKHKDLSKFPYMYSSINDQMMGWVKLVNPNCNDIGESEIVDYSYTESELQSGNPINGIIVKLGRPESSVRVLIDGNPKEVIVYGRKRFEKMNNKLLKEDTPCVIYWRDNIFNFNYKTV
jgi:CRISPR type III-A-associated RAMP protein Csm5